MVADASWQRLVSLQNVFLKLVIFQVPVHCYADFKCLCFMAYILLDLKGICLVRFSFLCYCIPVDSSQVTELSVPSRFSAGRSIWPNRYLHRWHSQATQQGRCWLRCRLVRMASRTQLPPPALVPPSMEDQQEEGGLELELELDHNLITR